MNIQDWFSLQLTGLISLQSKGLPRVFPNFTVQKHQSFGNAHTMKTQINYFFPRGAIYSETLLYLNSLPLSIWLSVLSESEKVQTFCSLVTRDCLVVCEVPGHLLVFGSHCNYAQTCWFFVSWRASTFLHSCKLAWPCNLLWPTNRKKMLGITNCQGNANQNHKEISPLTIKMDCCCSVAQWCPLPFNPMDCSAPGFPVLHRLPSCPSSRWCHPTVSPSVVLFSSCPQSFPTSGSFLMS